MDVKILMIDDHATILNGYKTILGHNNMGHNIVATTATSCELAFRAITNPETTFDMVLLDHSLPEYPEQKIYCGDDLVPYIKNNFPFAKIIILTAHYEAITLWQMMKKCQPDALLVKNDFDDVELRLAYEQVFKGQNYYSKTVTAGLKLSLLSEGHMDTIDQKIITLLNQGFQIGTIAKTINLSIDTIKKRKSKIKDLLNIDKGNDEDVLIACRLLQLI